MCSMCIYLAPTICQELFVWGIWHGPQLREVHSGKKDACQRAQHNVIRAMTSVCPQYPGGGKDSSPSAWPRQGKWWRQDWADFRQLSRRQGKNLEGGEQHTEKHGDITNWHFGGILKSPTCWNLERCKYGAVGAEVGRWDRWPQTPC